jgi:hypothetical protein
VRIAPGAPLPVHFHEGTQVATIRTDVPEGANRAKRPIVIIVAPLLAQGAPLATAVEAPEG